MPNEVKMADLFDTPEFIEAHGFRYVREDLIQKPIADDEFERWWKEYPSRLGKKIGKAISQAQYRKARAYVSTDTLLTSVQGYARSCGDYAVDPMRWLRDKRWLDEAETHAASVAQTKGKLQFYADLVNSDRPLFNAVKPSLAADLVRAGLVTPHRISQRGLS